MHNKKMFDIELENEGQGHGVQHSPWCNSMANIDLGKRLYGALFVIALVVIKILTFQVSDIVGSGQDLGSKPM